MRRGLPPGQTPSENLLHFTNREEALALLQECLDAPAGSPLPMLVFFGVAGAGKTWLRRRFREVLRERGDLPHAVLDLDQQRGGNPLADSLAERLLAVARQSGVACPRFEMAYYMMQAKQSHAADNPVAAGQGARGDDAAEALLGDLLGALLQEVPGASFAAKCVRLLSNHWAAPDRSRCVRAWVRSPEGKADVARLERADLPDIADTLIERLAADVVAGLPARPGKACRAVLLVDTWEHLRRGGLTAHQQYADRERWVVDLYGAAHAPDEHGTPRPILQVVLFGRDPVEWPRYDGDIREARDGDLYQCLVGDFTATDARSYLSRCEISPGPLQDAILRACEERRPGTGAIGYHPYELALCADTVHEERARVRAPDPASFDLPPGRKDLLTQRFLQSLDDVDARRIRRLALTPRFDREALQSLCSQGDPIRAEVQGDRLLGFSFVRPLEAEGWFALHPLMREGLLLLAAKHPEERTRHEHAAWREHWLARRQRDTDAFAALGWFHGWQLDPPAALAEWNRLAQDARQALRTREHLELLGWWAPTGIDREPEARCAVGMPLGPVDAEALNHLAMELTEAALGSSRETLPRAIAACRAALQVYACGAQQQRHAGIQNDLGNVLREHGVRTGGAAATALLAEAVAAYRAALQVYTPEDVPQQWATAQCNLGNGLADQGIRIGGEAGAALLAEAVAAYRAALQVRTRRDLPQDWAMTQNNLGRALTAQGVRTGGAAGVRLLAEAAAACRLALQVRTRQRLPRDWAMTQNNLGNALKEQGIRAGGEAGERRLGEAVGTYRAALEVCTREDLPQDWATAQDNLGNALTEQGIRAGGDVGAGLLAQAVAAHRAALEIRTREDVPQQWAMSQSNLGSALLAQGTCTGGEAGAGLLAQAVAAHRAALEVHTREDLPQDWAMTQSNLGNSILQQGIATGGEAGASLLDQAAAAHRAALQVFTREAMPQHWAKAQNNLGNALSEQGVCTSGDAGAALLAEAVAAYREALQVRRRDDLPQPWAMTQNNLGSALQAQGTRTGGEVGAELLAEAAHVYRAALQVYTREALPWYWGQTSVNLALALEAQGTHDEAAGILTEVRGVFPEWFGEGGTEGR